MIPTVRSVKVYQSDRDIEQYKVGLIVARDILVCSYVNHASSLPQVEYCLSKFRLKTNVEHMVDHNEVHPLVTPLVV